MMEGKKPEDSMASLLNKLDEFRTVENNLTTEEQKAVDNVSSALRELREIVKPLDMIKPHDSLGTRKRGLNDELHQLTLETFSCLDWYSTAVHAPQIQLKDSSARVPCKSLQDILSKVKGISMKYGRLLDDLKKIEARAPSIDDKALEEGSAIKRHSESGEGSSVTESTPGDSVLIQGGELVRFNRDKEELIQLLFNSGMKDVLVCGRRGSGKTTLVRKVCEDVRVREHFGTIAWISVPPISNRGSICQELLWQLLLENKAPVSDYLRAFDMPLEAQLIALLQKAKCLIVVDGLLYSAWDTFWEVLGTVDTCRVIFTAESCWALKNAGWYRFGRKYETYELQDLSVGESWALFRLKTFPEGDVPSPLEEVCQDIVRKCKGLPETIVLFSRLLRNNKGRNDELEGMVPSFNLSHQLDLIQEVLKIIYEDDRLGSCLLYLSLFPENSPISCMRVSRLWTAEGLTNDEPSMKMEAASLFQQLLRRKCIHPVETRSDGGLSTFRVDNLVREIIVSLFNRGNILRITREGSTNWPERTRYLSVQGTVKDLNEEKLSQLCSLLVFNVSTKDKTTMSEASPLENSENPLFTFNFKLLKVLDLTGAPLQIAPDALFELTLLEYLSLRDTSIKVIPGFIGKLKSLKFLDLKHSLVTELPPEVELLDKIRHILIYHHKKDPLMESYNLIGFKASCRVGRLYWLEKLCFVESDISILEDLRHLEKLRRLGITKLKAEHGELLCSSLDNLQNLESLNVHAFDEDEIIDLHYVSLPPKFLRHLYLHGRLEKLPNWISSLWHLTKIILRWTQLEEDLLATLGRLPKLVELELRRAYDGRQLNFKEGHFQELQILLLDELEGLRSMSLKKGTMPRLRNLTISRCQWLERIPSGIEHIPTIRKLTFCDMSDEFYEMVRSHRRIDGYRIFEDIPEVYFTRWRAGSWETSPFRQTKVLKAWQVKD